MTRPTPILPGPLGEIQRATFAARKRTGRNISTTAKAGRVRIVNVTYDAKGKATVAPISDYMPLSDLVRALDAL